MEREDEIRLIAYKLWEEEACVNGHDCEHWFRAEAIWEEKQKQGATTKGIKTELKQVAEKKPKGKTAKKI